MNIVLTGGNSGVGLELSKILIEKEHDLLLVLRNKERVEELPNYFKSQSNVKFVFGDLSIHSDLNKITQEIANHFKAVDILFNNAAVLLDKLYYSQQNNEMHFEVNTLAPYILTKNLSNLLKKSEDGLVVNTVTYGLHKRKELDISELLSPTKFKKLFGAYMESKYALFLLMNNMAFEENGFRILNIDPGPNKTKMTGGTGMPLVMKIIRNLFFPSPSKGANILYDASFNSENKKKTGIYITSGKQQQSSYSLRHAEVAKIVQR